MRTFKNMNLSGTKIKRKQPVYIQLAIRILICFLIFSSCDINSEWDDYYHKASVAISDNVLNLINENSNYSYFYEKLVETGYDSLLVKNQYFTLFVPTNSAFEGLPEYSSEEWKNIIGFHICYYNLFSKDFEDIDIKSVTGKYLKIRKAEDGAVSIFNANINLQAVDNNCQNGVIHEINQVLIPKKNVYEYIMALDENYSLMQLYLNSMDNIFIDLENSTRIGVDDNGNTIYDTVWKKQNYFLDNIAMLDNETEYYTVFIARDQDVLNAISNASEYFGDITELEDDEFTQLLSITFSANFYDSIYLSGELPDSMVSVVGKKIGSADLELTEDTDIEVSNGIIQVLDAVNIPKEFFLFPIIIECDEKKGRRASNTVYKIEIRSDSRATNGTYMYYESKFVGDYIEYTIDMVLATTYWVIWTGPALGGSYYQLSIDGTNVGDSVECYYKGNFKPVVSGSYTFETFGTKKVRMTMVNEETLPGYNAIYLDYINLIPDELYEP
jgi:uncharacterized surface protein with fasciclin (FAS1) repeats